VFGIYITTDYEVLAKSMMKKKIELVGGYEMFGRTIDGCYRDRNIVDFYNYCASLCVAVWKLGSGSYAKEDLT